MPRLQTHAHFIPINERKTMTAAPPPPAPAAPAPSPADREKQKADLARLLGVDPADLPELLPALEAIVAELKGLLGQGEAAERRALRLLSASERKVVANTPGASAVRYLAMKRKRGVR